MGKDIYASVMEQQIDQAKRYAELVEKHRAFWATPQGKEKHEKLMKYLDSVGTRA